MRDRVVPPLTVNRKYKADLNDDKVDALTDNLSELQVASSQQCHLLELNDDLIRIVTHELCDPLRPLLAVNLSSTAKGLRVPMQEQLAELRQRHAEAVAFAAYLGFQSCAALAGAVGLLLGGEINKPLTLAHWRTLGMLVGCGSLPVLERLIIGGDANGDDGMISLADGLRRGRLPSLQALALANAQIGPQGATALAPALTKRALPSLEMLHLWSNQIGDAGLAALAPALRQLPKLKIIHLNNDQITDLLAASSATVCVGILALSFLTMAPDPSAFIVFLAATIYGMGQTFFWPTTLGFVSEQFPRGGAMTLNVIAGVGMLGVGVLGNAWLGNVQDTTIVASIAEADEALVERFATEEKPSLFGAYRALDGEAAKAATSEEKAVLDQAQLEGKATALRKVVILPLLMLLAYLGLIAHFRGKGGYKPVELN